MPRRLLFPAYVIWFALLLGCGSAREVDGRPPHGDDDPYRVGLGSARLTTPQWIGEPGVDAAVVLAVDDMGADPAKYETFLRPILDRLKAIDGRAPVSVMACRVDPKHPTLPRWLAEGVSIEGHTLDHPNPFWAEGDFDKAASTVLDGLDLLGRIPGNRPVAFRMPYCDSMNSVSPRFFAEVFNGRSREGRFPTIDSSVLQLFTADDPALPRDKLVDAEGRERLRKYVPSTGFVNTIENYPYPYVVGRLCWEFPCMMPSDWEAQRVNGKNDPRTVDDLKLALDLTVAKQGVFCLVFHPHGWIKPEQVVALIDHAVATHRGKVRFLNFREAQERIDRNLLGGQPLRGPEGQDNGVRLADLDGDGLLDVTIGNGRIHQTRVWDPLTRTWKLGGFPLTLVDDAGRDLGGRFGASPTTWIRRDEASAGEWTFRGEAGWVDSGSALEVGGRPVLTRRGGRDAGVRLVDVDGDHVDELVVGAPGEGAIFTRVPGGWRRLPFRLPPGASVVDDRGRDAGLRFEDLDGDGRLDVVLSGDRGEGIFLFESMEAGWSRPVLASSGDGPRKLPRIVRDGTNNGAWFRGLELRVQNETTIGKPDLVVRRPFNELLREVPARPRSPEAGLRSIRVAPGFQVTLAAAEPLVTDPIAFDWGADGRLWVVEMGDYPLGVDGKGAPGGSIKVLDDLDGDGRYDRATVFLDRLGFPTGVLPWRDGALIARAPDILFARDEDGDGKADRTVVLFTGFVPGNQQHRLNGFDLGLDGWIYGANGDSGGSIRVPGSDKPVSIRGRDFRFDPDARAFEAETGQTQFGRRRDDWGHWFGNNNSAWAWHYVLSERALARNPSLALASPRQPLALDPRLFPDSRTLPRFNQPGAANRVTSANSPTPYRDDLFGPGFESCLFVSEPVHNLIRRIALKPAGATLAGEAALTEDGKEFLASTDPWFRPTMLRTGPDGALWVADMYRETIEHPEWIPDDQEARLDLRAGADRGRIYRVAPVGAPRRPIPRLDRLDALGLVAALESPNGWRRDTAQRLLGHRRDPAAVGPLRDLARSSPRAVVRVQALWTLRAAGGLDAGAIRAGLEDRHPQVRRAAVAVSGALTADRARVDPATDRLADDPDAEVRFELALALGDRVDPAAGRTLARLAARDGASPWARAAILSSCRPHAAAVLAGLFEAPGGSETGLIEPLFAIVGADADPARLGPILDAAGRAKAGRFAPWQFAAAAGLVEAIERSRPSEVAAVLDRLADLVAAARVVVGDEAIPEDRRIEAARTLGRSEGDRASLMDLLGPRVPPRLRAAALRALGRSDDRRVADALLGGWPGYTPGLRGEIVDALLDRTPWTESLLAGLMEGRPPVAEVAPAHRKRLREHPDPAVRHRASALFDRAGVSTRREILDAYRPSTKGGGDPAAGAAVFGRACSSCHRLGGVGTELGPDLAAMAEATPEVLLVAILDPNRAFEARYGDYAVHLVDGRTLTGLIAAEGGASLTLRRPEGREDVLLRGDVESVAASGRSLMPEGLEKDINPREFADLLAFLKAGRSAPPVVRGGR